MTNTEPTASKVDSRQLKQAPTTHAVHPLIRERWSARAFSDQPISEETLHTLFEAAAWAPSSMNEQPWRYRFALRGTPAFAQLVDCLLPGNKPWAQNAAVLVVSSGIKHHARNDAFNTYWSYDVGAANMNLFTQATGLGLYGHAMGGIDRAKAQDVLSIDTTKEEVLVFLALGYLGEADGLIEPFRTRELTPRTRRPLAELVTAL